MRPSRFPIFSQLLAACHGYVRIVLKNLRNTGNGVYFSQLLAVFHGCARNVLEHLKILTMGSLRDTFGVLWTSCCFFMLFWVFQGCGRHVVKHQRNIQGHSGGPLDFLLLFFLAFRCFPLFCKKSGQVRGKIMGNIGSQGHFWCPLDVLSFLSF